MSDLEIARTAKKKSIVEVAQNLNLSEKNLKAYGPHIAKIDVNSINSVPEKKFHSFYDQNVGQYVLIYIQDHICSISCPLSHE